LLYNLLSASACVLGAVATLTISHWLTPNLNILLAITAGAFIYLASADLMPLLRKNVEQPLWLHGLMMGLGVLLMLVLIGPEASHQH